MENQLVVFELANEHYGVDIAAVEGIIKMQQITVVPHAPSFVEGVTNLRGSVLPVIDLRKRFNLPQEELTKNSRIIHIAIDNVKVGMIVDGVSEVLRVSDDAIEPTPPIVSTVDSAFITGIAKLEGRLIIMLDLSKVLSINEQDKLTSLTPIPA
jgi:purine-binding chemotaxis protein CheW